MLSSPYINRFLQPDSIIPGAANPQSWNRYSYVGNNPIIKNDPTGHWENETNDPIKEQNDNAKKHADEWLKKKKDKGDGEEGTVYRNEERYGGNPVIGGCSPNNYECLSWELIDQMSNPYSGIYSDPTQYIGSSAMAYDLFVYDAYEISGHPLDLIADLQINNPMKDADWADTEVDVNYIHARRGAGSTNGVYVNFLNALDLDPENPNNYEANYLDAMMTKYDWALDHAKTTFYNDLLSFHGGDKQATYDWLLTNKEPVGAPD